MTNDGIDREDDLCEVVAALRRQTDLLASQLQAISDAVTERLDGERAVQPRRWENLQPDEARVSWEKLRAWVAWLRDRYALDQKTLPWCWYRHGALIEELSGLWTAHLAAYNADAHPGSPATWHDTLSRTLPRLREWAGRSGCRPGTHHEDIAQDSGEPPTDWSEHLANLTCTASDD